MSPLRFTAPLPMLPADHLVPLARAAEAAGYASVAVPDSVFFPEETSADYPFSDDGSRWWAPETPFVDPFVAVSAMAAVTERIRFFTNVVKLPLRDPLLVAKQVSSIAVLSHDRFALGVGLSWIPEEFTWTGTDKRTRGARTDEMIEIIRKVCAGDGPQWVEHDGDHYAFGRLMISPAPDTPVPILVGGHSEPAMRRAARLADGWISANLTEAQLGELVPEMRRMLAQQGRTEDGFEINALAVDVFDLDGFRRLADIGVTEAQVVPWFYYGGDPNDLQVQVDALHKFAETVMQPLAAEG
jgi:probable F420-dependent oxidoreductase